MDLFSFYRNKTVLVTGHTGFKGSWLTKILLHFNAKVIGYALESDTVPNLYELSKVENDITSIIDDVRDYDKLKKVFDTYKPEIVFHLAAQPLVRLSYKEPKYTYETNFLGTLNILEILRLTDYVKSFVNVTTDKVYKNNEWERGYFEDEPLDGYDPYSNSKSISELVTHTYKRAFFQANKVRISTARAGNVIGGGDFSTDRIIPDCVRSIMNNQTMVVRNPNSTRPYQHVLEPLFAYLLLAYKQYEDADYAGAYNIGPEEESSVTTGALVDLFYKHYEKENEWIVKSDGGPHEANFLKLDISKFKKKFNWKPLWNIETAVQKTVEWTKVYLSDDKSIPSFMNQQIDAYLEVFK